jgi:hypothetical protein
MRFGLLLVVCCALAAQSVPPVASDNPTEMQKALEEFKARTANLGVRAAGGGGNVSSGRARPPWHGRVYENWRNDFLDAVPHEITQRGGTKSLLRRNQFGFNVAGPLLIPKLYDGGQRTFVSLSFEGVRDATAHSHLQTVATHGERSGDFSATVDQAGELLPIFDPAATRLNPRFDPSRPVSTENLEYLRDPFPGNRIAAQRLDQVAQALLGYYPTPNAAAGPFDRNNYFLVTPESNDANGFIAKIDHNVRERHRFSVETSFSNGQWQPSQLLPSAANPGMPRRESQARRGSIEHVFTKSPRSVLTSRFVADTDISTTGEEGQPDYATKIGLKGSSPLAFPAFSIEPYVAMGRMSPRSRAARTMYQWDAGFSTRRDKHTLRVSLRHRREQVHVYSSRYPAGSFRFAEGLTSLPGIVNTGHAFASLLLGLPGDAEKSVVASPSYFRRSQWIASVREQYEVQKGLILNLGLELTYTGGRYEKYDRQSTVDLTATNPANGRPGALVVAGQGGVGRAFRPNFVKLEPRIGVAWNPRGDPKTVLRANFGRDYGPGSIQPNQWGTQAFNAAPSYISPNVQLEPALLLSQGLPPLAHPLPDTRPEAANDTVADLIDPSKRQPTFQSASIEVQRQLPFSVTLRGGFFYEGGKNIYVGNNAAQPNAIPLAALSFRDDLNDEAFSRSLRPYPQYKGFEIGYAYPAGRYQRRSGFVNLEKRATKGLSLNLEYEFSRQWDDYSGWYPRQDYYNSRNEWSLSAYNRPQGLRLSYIYEIPFGRGKTLLAFSGWRRHLVEGWAVSGSTAFSSGEPIMLMPQFNNTGQVVPGLRVNVVPGVSPKVSSQGPELWFNPAAFGQPADFTVGNGPRGHPTLRNPLSQNHDLSVTKRFALGRETSVEFSAVGLNFLNHADWEDPDPVIGPADAPNVNSGKIIGSRGGRVMQLGLRISF